MPNRDGTGPQGKGPMTWNKKGNCKWAQHIEFSRWKGNRWCKQRKGEGNRRKMLSDDRNE